MKKILFMAMLLVSTLAFSQSPGYYVSAGTSVSNRTATYSAEAGIYNEKTWYSLGVASSTVDVLQSYTGSFKSYFKVKKSGIVDNYLFTSFNVAFADASVSIEPGLAAVINVSKKWAPQFSVSFPIYENQPTFRNQSVSFGVGLNYWIK